MKNMFNVLPHNILQTNPCIRHIFSTQVFRKRAAQLHYVGPELRYIFWPPFSGDLEKCGISGDLPSFCKDVSTAELQMIYVGDVMDNE